MLQPPPAADRTAPTLALPALALVAGMAGYLLQPRLPPGWLILLVGLAGGLLALVGLWRRSRHWWLLPATGFGFLWAHVAVCALLCEPFPESLVGTDLVAVGRISGLPQGEAGAARFLFQIESLHRDGVALPWRGQVRLNWRRDPAGLEAGERWQLPVRLKPPHGFVNPGGFDYERWLFQQGIVATGYVRDPSAPDPGDRPPAGTLSPLRLDAGPGPYWLTRWRQGLRDRLTGTLGPGVGAALVVALVLGDQGGLTPAQWDVLARTGTSHLVSVSGLHVGLVAVACGFLALWLWSRSTRLSLWLAAPRAAAVAGLLAALGYSALAGFALPTQRSLVMLAVPALALLAGRALRPGQGLLVALLAVLLWDPLGLLSYGFWLSFGAVAVLFYALGGRLGPHGWLWRWTAPQWVVAVGLLPMLLLLFGRASLVAPPVNLLAVPAFGVLLPVVLGATLLLLVTGWGWPLTLIGAGLGWCYDGLAWIADWSWAAAPLGGRGPWVWAAAGAGVLLWLAPRGLPGRWLALVLLAPLLVQRPPAPAPGTLAVTVLDVGQGLSVLLRTAGHTLVYDTGPAFPTGFNTGNAVVAPALREFGVGRVDLLVISHGDLDHAGGMAGLLRAVPVARLISGEPAALATALAALPAPPPVAPCVAGTSWDWDGVRFALLHPADDRSTGNNAACVLRVSVGGLGLLLPGDIEASVERDLVRRLGADLRSDLLVAAHHGSATSTTELWLDAVAPAMVLYTAGYANRYGFPAETVRARVAARGIPALDTADSGAIGLLLHPDGRIEGPWRERARQDRLWRHHPAAGE